jgi:DNA-binding transcriptional ArsR family regulator
MARTHIPRTSRGEPDTRPEASVRDFRGTAATYKIEWDVRTVYDFVISLSDDAGSTDDLPPADRRWLTEARAALPESVRADREALLGTELCINIAELVVDRPDVRSPAAFVKAVGELDPRIAAEYFLADLFHEPEKVALVGRALSGDEAALADLIDHLPEHKRAGRMRVLRDPDGTVRRLAAILAAWQAPFAEIEPRVRAMIARDVEARAADVARLAPGDLIERVTGGVRYVPEPGIDRVILAPSYFTRPYNFLFSRDGWRLYAYPIADTALDIHDPLEPPPAVVRLHRALGDPSRLKILRLLADGDRYLTEIAQALELSKPTVKHHMAQLRAAGLVILTEEGSLTYYSLRREGVEAVGTDLRRFIPG